MIVMKFGGTSIADAKAITRVIQLIKARSNPKTVVVFSAISEATNILTNISLLAAKNKQRYKNTLAQFKNRHLKITNDLIYNKKLLKQTQNQINFYIAELEALLKEISRAAYLHDKDFAKTVAYGELLSSTILHTTMLEHNIKNTLIDARDIIITDNNYQKGTPILEKMTKIMPPLLNKYLEQGQIVITQGFIANTDDGNTTILGREGSDYSASLIGMIMDADEIQIWTDVDGMMSADPRKIANTKLIPALSFQEAALISQLGAKVIHPLTIQPAAQKNIPVRILNSMNLDPKQTGTLITHNIQTKSTKISSITYKENIQVINILSKQQPLTDTRLQKIFALLDNQQIIVNAATISKTKLSLVIDQQFNKITDKLALFGKIITEENLALIGIIGKNFNNMKITVKNICHILEDFNIRMIMGDPSNIDLILIVRRNDVITIVQKLHDAFFGRKPEV